MRVSSQRSHSEDPNLLYPGSISFTPSQYKGSLLVEISVPLFSTIIDATGF